MDELEQQIIGIIVGVMDDYPDFSMRNGEHKVALAFVIRERMSKAGIKFMVPKVETTEGRFDKIFMWAEEQKGSTISIDDLSVEGVARIDPCEDTTTSEQDEQLKAFRKLNTQARHAALAKYYKERGYTEAPPAASEFKELITWVENRIGEVTTRYLTSNEVHWLYGEMPMELHHALNKFREELSPSAQQQVIIEHYTNS